MCLFLKQNDTSFITDKEIECYKIVRLKDNGTIMETPYQKAIVEFNQTYFSDLAVNNILGKRVMNGLHSFANLIDAKLELNEWNETQPLNQSIEYKIAKCIIPEHSEVFVGTFNVCDFLGSIIKTCGCYASDTIFYKEFAE